MVGTTSHRHRFLHLALHALAHQRRDVLPRVMQLSGVVQVLSRRYDRFLFMDLVFLLD